MNLNHLNICTTEVRASAAIFERFFGFKNVNAGASDKFSVLKNEEGFLLLFSNFDRKTAITYPDGFHFGFILESKEAVNAVYQELNSAGLASEPPSKMHRSWTFYFNIPGNVMIEVQCMDAD